MTEVRTGALSRWLEVVQITLIGGAVFAFYLVTWISPFALDPRAPQACMAMFIMEFITIHSTALLAAAAKARWAVLLSLLYVPFVITIAVVFKIAWPLVLFALHLWSTTGAILGSSAERRDAVQARWAVSLVIFLATALLAAMIPWPGLGWNGTTTPDMAWSSEDGDVAYHITPVWGVLYFAVMTVADVVLVVKRGRS